MLKTEDGSTTYPQVAFGTATSTGWTQLAGGYALTVTGNLTELTLYVEIPSSATVSFYADDFVIEAYDWKAAANAGIEMIRKRDVRLLIEDSVGNPVPGATVEVRQTRRRFAFGSEINYNIANPAYAAFFRTNFEWAVMGNESKWYANEPSRSNVTYTVADSITNYCHTNGITLRGHCLFWAVEQYGAVVGHESLRRRPAHPPHQPARQRGQPFQGHVRPLGREQRNAARQLFRRPAGQLGQPVDVSARPRAGPGGEAVRQRIQRCVLATRPTPTSSKSRA